MQFNRIPPDGWTSVAPDCFALIQGGLTIALVMPSLYTQNRWSITDLKAWNISEQFDSPEDAMAYASKKS